MPQLAEWQLSIVKYRFLNGTRKFAHQFVDDFKVMPERTSYAPLSVEGVQKHANVYLHHGCPVTVAAVFLGGDPISMQETIDHDSALTRAMADYPPGTEGRLALWPTLEERFRELGN